MTESEERFCNDTVCYMRTFHVVTERTVCLGCGSELVTVSILGDILGGDLSDLLGSLFRNG